VSADGLRWGVEPICSVLTEHGVKIAPSTYYAARKRPASSIAQRHALLLPEVVRVQTSKDLGRGLYGARKVWKQLLREDVNIGRGQVETLMRTAGLKGIRRGKQYVTTRSDKAATRPPDLVDRNFTASRPNELWVVDFTYVATWSGMVFSAFVHDVFQPTDRRVAHRSVDAHRAPLDALEMALWTRARAGQATHGVVHHTDAGTQGTPRSATASACWTPVRSRASARSETATTTPRPRA